MPAEPTFKTGALVSALLALALFGSCECGSQRPQAGDAPRRVPRPSAAASLGGALDRVYPLGGAGYATRVESKELFVHVVAAGDHWVYVTDGRGAAAPHEFVLRVFGDAQLGAQAAWQAPLWPVRVLTEIIGVELRTGRNFESREDLRNVALPGEPLPYRHFSFLRPDPDRALAEVGTTTGLRFVRVIPLTDSEKGEIYDSGKLGVLADWYAQDPLMRVPRR